jgi:hypothetical protein
VSGLVWLRLAGLLVGMYLRTTPRKNRDGSVIRYVQLAHNRRVEEVTQAQAADRQHASAQGGGNPLVLFVP